MRNFPRDNEKSAKGRLKKKIRTNPLNGESGIPHSKQAKTQSARQIISMQNTRSEK